MSPKGVIGGYLDVSRVAIILSYPDSVPDNLIFGHKNWMTDDKSERPDRV